MSRFRGKILDLAIDRGESFCAGIFACLQEFNNHARFTAGLD